MPWTKIDDGFHTNPKIIGLSHQAFRLYVLALNWSVAESTDGKVTEPAVATKLPLESTQARRKAIAELEDAGLWHRNGSGWAIHDFHDFQPSASKVKARSTDNRKAAIKGNHQRWHVERNQPDRECPLCEKWIAAIESEPPDQISKPIAGGSQDAIDMRGVGDALANRVANRPVPEPVPDNANRDVVVENGIGGLQGGLPKPKDIPKHEWDVACQLAAERIAEGYQVTSSLGGFVRTIWKQDRALIRQRLARDAPIDTSVAELLADITDDLPEDT